MTQSTEESRLHGEPDDIHGVGAGGDLEPLTFLDDMLALAPVPASGLGHSTVLNSDDVRVIVLSFAAGHVLKEHAAPFTILLQALDGRLSVTSAGRVLDLRPGGLIRMDASLPHSVEAITDSRLMLTLVAG
jgi:hypothetical protein